MTVAGWRVDRFTYLSGGLTHSVGVVAHEAYWPGVRLHVLPHQSPGLPTKAFVIAELHPRGSHVILVFFIRLELVDVDQK